MEGEISCNNEKATVLVAAERASTLLMLPSGDLLAAHLWNLDTGVQTVDEYRRAWRSVTFQPEISDARYALRRPQIIIV